MNQYIQLTSTWLRFARELAAIARVFNQGIEGKISEERFVSFFEITRKSKKKDFIRVQIRECIKWLRKKMEEKKVLLIKRRIHALCVKIGTCSLGL